MDEKKKRGRPEAEAVGIGVIWRRARESKGLSVDEAAKEIGAHRSTIRKIERGAETNPGLDMVRAAPLPPVLEALTLPNPSLNPPLTREEARKLHTMLLLRRRGPGPPTVADYLGLLPVIRP